MATPVPTDEEAIAYNNAICDMLRSGSTDKWADDVAQAGVWANEVDASFDSVTREFTNLRNKYTATLPEIVNYHNEWVGYRNRWVRCLQNSRNVASMNVAMLRRFDRVFVDMVMQVETDRDREEAIEELQSFIEEDHSDAENLYTAFQELQRDVGHFLPTLHTWLNDKEFILTREAERLRGIIERLKKDVQYWDQRVKNAEIALASMLAIINIIGIAVAGSYLADFRSRRAEVAKELEDNQDALERVNQQQQGLVHMRTRFDGLEPDFDLICDRLGKFAEIWTNVQSQCVQFIYYMRNGYNARNNARFRSELRLAKEASDPLQAGLRKYATVLGRSLSAKT